MTIRQVTNSFMKQSNRRMSTNSFGLDSSSKPQSLVRVPCTSTADQLENLRYGHPPLDELFDHGKRTASHVSKSAPWLTKPKKKRSEPTTQAKIGGFPHCLKAFPRAGRILAVFSSKPKFRQLDLKRVKRTSRRRNSPCGNLTPVNAISKRADTAFSLAIVLHIYVEAMVKTPAIKRSTR